MLLLTRQRSFRFVLITRRVPLPATPLRFLAVMPPKLKRKATEESPPPKKRVKKSETMNSQASVASTSASQTDLPGQPTNTQLPDEISFPGSIPGTVRISAWNICSWAASNKKVSSPILPACLRRFVNQCSIQGFGRYVEAEDADILVLTETKVCVFSFSSATFTQPLPRSTTSL